MARSTDCGWPERRTGLTVERVATDCSWAVLADDEGQACVQATVPCDDEGDPLWLSRDELDGYQPLGYTLH